MVDLKGKNAIVTGASRGVGVYIARALAQRGVNLVLTARDASLLKAVSSKLSALGLGIKIVIVSADLSQPEEREYLVLEATRALGPIDILINNAGITEWAPYASQDPKQIVRILETNLNAPMLLARMLMPGMLHRGYGHIVNNVSMAGKKGIPYEAAYSASKAGILQWSSAMRVELEGRNVGMSSILPSIVKKSGMSANHGLPSPALAGAVSPEAVARAVIKALRRNPSQIIVRRMPTRPFLALAELWPSMGDRLLKMTGIVKLQRKLVKQKGVKTFDAD